MWRFLPQSSEIHLTFSVLFSSFSRLPAEMPLPLVPTEADHRETCVQIFFSFFLVLFPSYKTKLCFFFFFLFLLRWRQPHRNTRQPHWLQAAINNPPVHNQIQVPGTLLIQPINHYLVKGNVKQWASLDRRCIFCRDTLLAHYITAYIL